MLRGNIFKRMTRTVLVVLCLLLTGCFASSTQQGPPAMETRGGIAPKAAMLPVLNTNDAAVAEQISERLVMCLEERNVLDFISKEQVQKVVDESGYDLGKAFGLKDKEYKDLADKLGVQYTVHGVVSVRKTLTFAGWRKDVDAYIYIHDGETGEKLDSWRSMTDFSFGKVETVTDAREMGQAVANHICTKMLERSY
jgi:hypothetical protein